MRRRHTIPACTELGREIQTSRENIGYMGTLCVKKQNKIWSWWKKFGQNGRVGGVCDFKSYAEQVVTSVRKWHLDKAFSKGK